MNSTDEADSLAQAREVLGWHFPVPFEDETLYSACARFHHVTGFHSGHYTSTLLFGHRKGAAKRCVPSGLPNLVSVASHAFESVEQALYDHTIGALYFRFMPQAKIARAIEACDGRSHVRSRYPFGWSSSTFERQHPLRFCSECYQLEPSKYGVAFWHLSHQLPGVLVCATHRRPLQYLPPKNASASAWLLPSPICKSSEVKIHSIDGELLYSVADVVMRLSRCSMVDLQNLRNAVCRELENIGVAKASNALNPENLRRWLRSHLPGRADTYFEGFGQVNPAASLNGILGKKVSHHPLRWAILIACLRKEGISLDQFFTSISQPTQRLIPGLSQLSPKHAPAEAYLLVAKGDEILDIAKAARVSRSVIQRWFQDDALHLIWSEARFQRRHSTHLAAIQQAIACGAVSRADVKRSANAAVQWFEKNDLQTLQQLCPTQGSSKQLNLW